MLEKKKKNETKQEAAQIAARLSEASVLSTRLTRGVQAEHRGTRAVNGAFRRHNSSPLLVFGGRSNQQRHRRAGKENKSCTWTKEDAAEMEPQAAV